MKKHFSIWLFFGVCFIVPLSVYAIVNWYEKNKSPLPVYGGEGHVISNFEMINEEGERTTIEKWRGKIVVANFFFTHCPVICPKMTKNLKQLQNDNEVTLCSFTVDPERDDATRLKNYANRFSINTQNWHLLTGDKKEIYRLARKSFLITATDGDGGEDDFIHSDKLALLDKKQRIRGYYSGTDAEGIQQLIKDIKKLKNER